MSKNPIKKAVCWWFGCQPDSQAMDHGSGCCPCDRCGAADTTYADQVGDTRHQRTLDAIGRLWWRAVGQWPPAKCPACGERIKCRPDCDGIPF